MFSNDRYYEDVYFVLRKENLYFNTTSQSFYTGEPISAEFATLDNAFRFEDYKKIYDFRNAHSKLHSWDIVRVDEKVSVNRTLTKE